VAARQLAEDLLRAPLVVLVGAVEEVDAELAAGAVHLCRLALVGIAAEGHGTQAKARNPHAGAAKQSMFHLPEFSA